MHSFSATNKYLLKINKRRKKYVRVGLYIIGILSLQKKIGRLTIPYLEKDNPDI